MINYQAKFQMICGQVFMLIDGFLWEIDYGSASSSETQAPD